MIMEDCGGTNGSTPAPKWEQGMIGDKPTAGKIAYDAYFKKCGGKSLASGAPLPTYAEQKPEMVVCWEAAAEAVVEAVTAEVAALFKSGQVKP